MTHSVYILIMKTHSPMRSGLDLRRLGWDLQSKSFNLAQDLVKLRWKDGHLLWGGVLLLQRCADVSMYCLWLLPL